MRSNLDNHPLHPEELLEGFALNALEPDEEQSVEAHLDGCTPCAAAVEEYLRATAALAWTVAPLAPRPELRLHLLNALDALPDAAPAESAAAAVPPVAHPTPPTAAPAAPRGFWALLDALFAPRWMRALMPAATVTAVALVVVAVALNAGMSREITELRAQMDSSNATLSAQMADEMGQSMAADLSLQQIIQQVQEASLALARPGSRTALLSSPGANSGSEGVLVLGENDAAATIIASGLAPTDSGQTYQIWLMGPWENRMIGTLAVNADGWGAVSLHPQEPVSLYERVGLRLGAADAPASAPDMEEQDLVLQGEIRALRPPDRMVQLPWPQPRLR